MAGKRSKLQAFMNASASGEDKIPKTTPVDTLFDEIDKSNLSNLSDDDINDTSNLSDDDISNENNLSDNTKSNVSYISDGAISELSYSNDLNNLSRDEVSDDTISNSKNLSDAKNIKTIDDNTSNLSNTYYSSNSSEPKVKYTVGLLPDLKQWLDYKARTMSMSTNKYVNYLIDKCIIDGDILEISQLSQIKSECKGSKIMTSYYLTQEEIENFRTRCAQNGLNKTDYFNYIVRKEMNNLSNSSN